MERQQDNGFPGFLSPKQSYSSLPSTAGQGVPAERLQSDIRSPGFPPATAYPAFPRSPAANGSHGASTVFYGLGNLSNMSNFIGSTNQLRSTAYSLLDSGRSASSGESDPFFSSSGTGGGHPNNSLLFSAAGSSCLSSPQRLGVYSSVRPQCPPPPVATSQKNSPVASTAPTPSPLTQSQKQPSSPPSSPALANEYPGLTQPNMYGRSLGDPFHQENAPRQEHTSQPQLGQHPRAASPLATPLRPHATSAHHPDHYVRSSCLPGSDCQEVDAEPYGEGQAERLWNFSSRGSLSFDDLIAQVQKLLQSNSTSSSASSASTPRRPSGRLGETVDMPWENKPMDNRSIWARRPMLGRPPIQQQGIQEGRENVERGDEEYSGCCVGQLDLHALQGAATQSVQPYRPVGDSSSPREPVNEGVNQNSASYIDPQALAVLQELHRTAVQQRMWEANLAVLRQENADLQNRITLMEETQSFLKQQNQSLRAAQHSAEASSHGAAKSILGVGRPATNKSATNRLIAPSGYQGPDQIQSAPNPSTPIIKGSDKISVEQFLLSFPFTLTQDYPHAILKFCADHNLVVKLLGYHGKRVELLERQYCCRIQTSAQASSFPGYPNGRCVLFTGPLVSLLRACADLYAVVDTSSPGLRTNIEGYRVCLVVPGDFVGRLLRSNCAGLHALQEAGGKAVHIALGNLCVIMRGNYSERVLLIDGNIEGVCQVLESAAAQLQDFLRRFSGGQGGAGGGGSEHLATRYEFLEYPKRIELHLST
ncbi:putative KH domain containing protein [Neospora caninum Liverpool]|uniref:KH domain containing protein, putative n=1 Tax=Neospora caninum (strain Liverpool) TaxID=572307 RepID=F0VEP5_NEOCL|nr:putative KH domain containing protein [Neospora caninum Liverpool]CBZ52189.1 putative KH domain containing protein [Neospora caninum Liverpool]CEL66157.1 TPA: KH domain containing protein, putative [Neospora caninum Liverpool]|eukprot:XP_003882221.1 putative KH domain containing protein [Neospora caninum Liverpool]